MELLVLDEALDGLDEEGRRRVLHLIRKEYPGRPVFLISHDYLNDDMFDYKWYVSKRLDLTEIAV